MSVKHSGWYVDDAQYRWDKNMSTYLQTTHFPSEKRQWDDPHAVVHQQTAR
jgi:hypothetical protein